jgi:hypothetical protein
MHPASKLDASGILLMRSQIDTPISFVTKVSQKYLRNV